MTLDTSLSEVFKLKTYAVFRRSSSNLFFPLIEPYCPEYLKYWGGFSDTKTSLAFNLAHELLAKGVVKATTVKGFIDLVNICITVIFSL